MSRVALGRGRVVVPFVLVACLVVGGRWFLLPSGAAGASAAGAAHRRSHGRAPFPSSSAIEEAWGIRFTAIDLLADGGLVDVQYQVVDPSKGERIHTGFGKNLPLLRVERNGKVIRPTSVMFHFQHEAADKGGRTYSIIYGNAGGAMRAGDRVTVVLPDGSRLAHVPVEV